MITISESKKYKYSVYFIPQSLYFCQQISISFKKIKQLIEFKFYLPLSHRQLSEISKPELKIRYDIAGNPTAVHIGTTPNYPTVQAEDTVKC